MDRYLCFVLMIVAFPFAMPQSTERGPCKCGVFPVGTSKSIIERSFQLNVTCDNEGLEQCVALCVALAKTAQDRMPQMICEAIEEHVENLQVAVFAETCDSLSWTFTGLKSEEPFLCCHDRKSISC
nr:uncharacterized protein LOC117219308 [Megalopta genalis]